MLQEPKTILGIWGSWACSLSPGVNQATDFTWYLLTFWPEKTFLTYRAPVHATSIPSSLLLLNRRGPPSSPWSLVSSTSYLLTLGHVHPQCGLPTLLRPLDAPCPSMGLLVGITPMAPAAPPEALLGSRATHISLHDLLFLCQSVLPYSEPPPEPARASSLGNTG